MNYQKRLEVLMKDGAQLQAEVNNLRSLSTETRLTKTDEVKALQARLDQHKKSLESIGKPQVLQAEEERLNTKKTNSD